MCVCVCAVIAVQTSLNVAAGGCYFDAWALAAMTLASTNLGVSSADFVFRHFVMPEEAGQGACNFGGLAYLGCSRANCRSWVRQAGAATSAHELGHSLGMNHASVDVDNDGQIDDEYGDTSCNMGADEMLKRYNAPHR